MPLRVLVTGDIHLGRTSSRLPPTVPAPTARAVSGWHAVVDLALEHRFDLLLLTGDVADQDNRFWEAVGPLGAGIRRLADAGIRTLAVSGNHDHDVLPRLADHLGAPGAHGEHDAFVLLGRDGVWERYTVEAGGRPVLHVDGWSFPRATVDVDPTESYPAGGGGTEAGGAGVPVIGMVHGDLGALGSRYAPLSLDRLRRHPVDGWVLGHVHKPLLVADRAPFVLYPGSPQALDFGETGVHGAWQFQVEAGRVSTPAPVPLSFCRYEDLAVDVAGAETEPDLERMILAAVQGAEARGREESGAHLEAMSLRVRLTGRSPFFDRIEDLAQSLEDYTGEERGLAVRIDRVRSEVLPAVDLEALARGSSSLGVAARMLRDLEAAPDGPDAPSSRALVDATVARLAEVADGRGYRALRDEQPLDETTARAILRDRLTFILGRLLQQQEGGT